MRKDDRLEVILIRAIYEGIKDRCRGKITVDIKNNTCAIHIALDDLEYEETICRVAEKILNGNFTSSLIVDTFINNWREYAKTELYEKLFRSRDGQLLL